MSAIPLHATPARSTRWRWWALGASLLVSCIAAVVLVTLTCTGRVLPGRSLGHHDLAGMTREDLIEFTNTRLHNTVFTLVLDGKEMRVPLAQTGIVIDTAALADTALEGSGNPLSSLLALTHLGGTHTISVPASIDPDTFANFAREADALTGHSPVPASVELSEDGTHHVARGGTPGTGVDRDTLREHLMVAASQLETAAVSLTSSALDARPTLEEAKKAAQKADEIAATSITLIGPNDTSFTPDDTEKVAWVSVHNTGETLVPSVDPQSVSRWVESAVEQVERSPINGVNAVDTQGKLLRLARPSKVGRTVTNSDRLRDDIVNALDSGSEYSGTIEWDSIPAQMENRVTPAGVEGLPYRPQPGEKWVDVNLTDSTLTVFRGQEVAYGPILINHGGVGHETVTGTYRVYLKYKAQDMGCTPDWPYCERAVPWVAYWHQSYALHGAPWVKEFGIGTDESSHGCINIPVDDAHWIHDFVDIGTVVVSHY